MVGDCSDEVVSSDKATASALTRKKAASQEVGIAREEEDGP